MFLASPTNDALASERGLIIQSYGSGYLWGRRSQQTLRKTSPSPNCQHNGFSCEVDLTNEERERNVRKTAIRHLGLELHRPPVLIQRRRDVKHVQHRCDRQEEAHLREMTSRTYPDINPISTLFFLKRQPPSPFPRSPSSSISDEKVAHLLPKPNAAVLGSRIWGFNCPSLMNRSGSNSSGSGYISGSCKIALQENDIEYVFLFPAFLDFNVRGGNEGRTMR